MQKPVVLDDHVLDFIASSLGGTTPDDLGRLFESCAESDAAVVLDLVFSPTHALQLELESILDGSALGQEQVGRLAGQLAGKGLSGRVSLPGEHTSWPVCLPPEAIEAFLKRLNLDWCSEPLVKTTLESHLPAGIRQRLLVFMRNQRCRFHRSSAAFTAGLTRLMQGHEDFSEIFETLVCSFSQWPQGLEAAEFLTIQRRICAETLTRAAVADSFRRRAGLEYALSSGIRLPYVDVTAVRRKMVLLDEVWKIFLEHPGAFCGQGRF